MKVYNLIAYALKVVNVEGVTLNHFPIIHNNNVHPSVLKTAAMVPVMFFII